MNKVMRLVESHLKMEQVVKGFMLNLDYDYKNPSLAGQSLDMILYLVAP